MAESQSSQSPPPSSSAVSATATDSDTDTSQYWCHHCNKRVSIETLTNLSEVVCLECKNGFVQLIPASAATPSSSASPSLSPDQADDSPFGSQFLQMLRIISQVAGEDDDVPPPPPPPQGSRPEDDFLRIELDGWDNDEDEDEDDNDDDDDNDTNENAGERNGEGGGGEDRSDNEHEENREEEDEEDMRRRRLDILRLRIRDFATRSRSGRNRILDWAEILMGLEDNSIELRLEVPEPDRYVGNPEDYVDAAGFESLLQTLAESDNGRRGAPPASKAAVSELPVVEISSEEETVTCAICKDMINVGELETKLPCGHGYHGECIVPWLGSRNSCPVCRLELPTDDLEYEEERKKRVGNYVGGASGSGGGNS